MKTIKYGDIGEFVSTWQMFLLGQGYYKGAVDGDFGHKTEEATIAFQRKYKLYADGVVGNKTIGQAMTLGLHIVDPVEFAPKKLTPLTTFIKQSLFGNLAYIPNPQPNNPEAIKITNGWDKKYIVTVNIPQLIGVKGASKTGNVQFHGEFRDQLIGLWNAWEKKGLLPLILSYGGSWVPRFVRGSRSTLSSHSWGTAFDINMQWNRLGADPAAIGEKGSVRPLVDIADDWGFFWGGHFKRRPDGMHFEIAEKV